MRFSDYWQQFEHTGSVEDYLNYRYHTDRTSVAAVAKNGCRGDCRAEEQAGSAAGEDGPCRNPCM